MKPLVIIGAGGHGRVVLDVARACGLTVAGFVADAAPSVTNGVPFLGGQDILQGAFLADHSFVVAIGHQTARREISNALREKGSELATIVHPRAWISPSAVIGAGTVVVGGVDVNANASIGDYCILNTGCSVDHDNRLEDGVQICPGAHLAGTVHCERGVFIGTGATIIPGVRIGANAIIGAGAVVIRDVPANATVVGNPAEDRTVRSGARRVMRA